VVFQPGMGCAEGRPQCGAFLDLHGLHLGSEHIGHHREQPVVPRPSGRNQNPVRTFAHPGGMKVHGHGLRLGHGADVPGGIGGGKSAETPHAGFIFLLNLIIGLKVGSGMTLLCYYLLKNA